MSTLRLLREYAAVEMVLRDADAEGAANPALAPLIREAEGLLADLFPDGGPPEQPERRAHKKFGVSRRSLWRRLGARVTSAADVPWDESQWGFGTKTFRTICEELRQQLVNAYGPSLDTSPGTFCNSFIRVTAERLSAEWTLLTDFTVHGVEPAEGGNLSIRVSARLPATIHAVTIHAVTVEGTVEV